MNNYEKMTFASFVANLKAKKYKNATGARRAVGKSQDLSNADKDKARAEINKFFGVTDGVAPKKAAKKIQPKAKASPKKAAKKVVAKAAPKAVPAKHVKRQPVIPQESQVQSTDARVMRQHAAAQVLATLHGKHPLEPELEAKLLRTSALEYIANASIITDGPRESSAEATPAISQKERVARPRVNVQKAAPAAAPQETAPESGPEQRINGTAEVDMSGWTQEQIDQYKKLGEMKEVAERS